RVLLDLIQSLNLTVGMVVSRADLLGFSPIHILAVLDIDSLVHLEGVGVFCPFDVLGACVSSTVFRRSFSNERPRHQILDPILLDFSHRHFSRLAPNLWGEPRFMGGCCTAQPRNVMVLKGNWDT